MGLVTHNGKTPPTLDEYFDPDSIQRIWFAWPEDSVILTSEFILQTGILEVNGSELTAQPVEINGVTYPNANSILVDFNSASPGRYLITNRVTLPGGETSDRSAYARVRTT